MHGKALTRPSSDLHYLFSKIRSSYKGSPERRSWQRRARIALNAIEWLTPAERHEIMCVWSNNAVSHIDSPALRKLLSHGRPRPFARLAQDQIPARHFMRARFDAQGQPTRKKRPVRLARATLEAMPATATLSSYARITAPPFAAQIVLPTAPTFSIAGVVLNVRRTVNARPVFGQRLRC